MDFTANTFIGLITALSGIIIAIITSYVSRRKDSDGVITTREQQVSAEMWKIIEELKEGAKEADEQKAKMGERLDALEQELRESRIREFTLMAENSRLAQRVSDLEQELRKQKRVQQ